MADKMTPEQRHRCMSHIRGKDTKPELIVRRWLWHQGYRYRLNVKSLPGKPDIVLPRYSTVIFVNGCFWHAHEKCDKYKVPLTNPDFWTAKFKRNRERDEQALAALEEQGWTALVIWECELDKKNVEATRERLKQTVEYAFVQFENEQTAKAERTKQAEAEKAAESPGQES